MASLVAASSVLLAPLLPRDPVAPSEDSSSLPSLSSSETHHFSSRNAGLLMAMSGFSRGSPSLETQLTQPFDFTSQVEGTSNAMPWSVFTTVFQPCTVGSTPPPARGLPVALGAARRGLRGAGSGVVVLLVLAAAEDEDPGDHGRDDDRGGGHHGDESRPSALRGFG